MLKDQIDGKNNSWAIRWYMSAFLKNMLTLYPSKSYVQNIGMDNSGTHCSANNTFKIELNYRYNLSRIDIVEDIDSKKEIEKYFFSIQPTILQKIKIKIKRILS